MTRRIEPWVVALVQLRKHTRLHALAVQCHAIEDDGRLRPLSEVPPSVLAPRDELQWRPDDDLAPHKPCTDVVVIGSAIAPGGTQVRRLLASVAVPEVGACARVLVLGDRRAVVCGDAIEFTPPEPFERMPLDWRRAYGGPGPVPTSGGAGPAAACEPADAADDVLGALLRQRAARGGHPRNPVGRGWSLAPPHRGAASEPVRRTYALPNIEDPDDLLTPASLVGARPWWAQPVPRGFGWVAPTWFPRAQRFGAAIDPMVDSGVDSGPNPSLDPGLEFGWASGAVDGLAVPWLRGGETLDTRGMHVAGRWLVRLPAPRGTRARWAGGALDVRWRIHTLCADLHAGVLTLVWRAELLLPTPLSHRLGAADGAAQRFAEQLELVADLTGVPT